MAKRKYHTYTISAKMAEQRFTGFIDMLRYDSARVIEASGGVIVLSSEYPPTNARWASFGIYVLSQQEGEYPDIRELRAQAQDKLP